MRPTLPAIALVLVATLACAGVALLLGGPPGSRGLPAPPVAAAEAMEGLPAAAPVTQPRGAAPEVAKKTDAEPLEESGNAEEQGASGGHSVRGTLVLIDGEDQELPAANGRFEVLSRVGDEEARATVEVIAGRFTFLLPDPELCVVESVSLSDGRRAALVADYPGGLLSGPVEDLFLEVLARPLAEVSLVVVDAVTRGHLSGLEVRQAYDADTFGELHPGAEEGYAAVHRDLASPARLKAVEPDWATATTCWVHAPGYSWNQITVDHVRGGEYVVALEPGGELHLEVLGTPPRAQAVVRLRRAGEQAPALEEPYRRGEPLEWQGVPTGFLQATLEIGDWWDDCEVLGTTAVEIAAGERTLAVIEVSPVVSAPGSVRCTGTVRAGAFWREHGFDLRFNPLGKAKNWVHRSPSVRADDLVVDPSDPDLLHWELTLPAAGTWQLVFGTTALHADFEAVAPVTEGVNLVVPDPAELRFTVRDAVTDEVIEDAGLYWAYAGASVLESIIWTPPEYDGESGVHSLVIPAGRITAEVWADGYARTEAVELDLPPGVTEREWFLDPSAGALRFTFQEGENTIQANLMEWEVEVEPLDGEGDIDWISDDTIVFTAPGRYRIRMSGRAGYLPVELEAEAPLVGTDFVQVTIERE